MGTAYNRCFAVKKKGTNKKLLIYTVDIDLITGTNKSCRYSLS
jgi:hypothetical protein